MTKKDYILIADAYLEASERYPRTTAQDFLTTLMVRLGAENSRFNSHTFLAYIGYKSKK